MIWTNRWNILAFSGGMVTKLQDQGKEEQYACCIRILKWYSILKSLYSNWTDVTDITIDYECMLKFSGDLTHYGTMFVQLAGLRKHDVHHDFRMAPAFYKCIEACAAFLPHRRQLPSPSVMKRSRSTLPAETSTRSCQNLLRYGFWRMARCHCSTHYDIIHIYYILACTYIHIFISPLYCQFVHGLHMTRLDRISRKFIRCQNHATPKHLCHLLHLCQAEIETLTSKMETGHCLPPSEQEGVHVILFILCSYLFKFCLYLLIPCYTICMYLFEGNCNKARKSGNVMWCLRRQFTQQFGHRKAPWPQRTSASSRARSLHRFVVFFLFFSHSVKQRGMMKYKWK